MALWLCIIAIVISILVGWKFKLNTGILAMGFAFVIGICVMGLKASAIIAFWPTTIVFYLLSISLFFNYATGKRHHGGAGAEAAVCHGAATPSWCPLPSPRCPPSWAGLGAGASTPAIVGPFAFVMAATAGVNPVLTAITITFGNLVGSNNPYNGYGGSISKNLIIANGVDEVTTMDWSLKIWFNCCIITIIIIVLFYLVLKGHKADKVAMGAEAARLQPDSEENGDHPVGGLLSDGSAPHPEHLDSGRGHPVHPEPVVPAAGHYDAGRAAVRGAEAGR